MSFFSELKRRNVIRIGILYLVGAWLLLQLTDVFSSLLHVPDWTGSLVIMLLSLGFIPVLIFAWVFEMTPEGLRREKDIEQSTSITDATGKKINYLIIGLLILAIGSVALDRLLPSTSGQHADSGIVASSTAKASIAVLPFSDMSAEQDQKFFTDGISEELLNVLVRVDDLQVASRTSSFGYRDTSLNVSQIGQELKVRNVLEGSVRKDKDRIRITAQLIDAKTDKHLWSATYDRELKDIFKVQDEIANAIVDALIDKLGIEKGQKVVNVVAATENLDAYELYLKGRDLFQRRERLEMGVSLLEQAVELDPKFARAWETLSAAQWVTADWYRDKTDYLAHSILSANKAIELDPTLSMPYAVLASNESLEGNLIESIRLFDQAIVNDPKNASAYLWRAINFRTLGYFDESIKDLLKCLDIDPMYLNCTQHLAATYLAKGEVETALQIFEGVLAENFHSMDYVFVPVYLERGQRLVAMLLVDRFPPNSQAPVKELIEAIEDPNGDQKLRRARFDRWSESFGNRKVDNSLFLFAWKEYDRVTLDTGDAETMVWTRFGAGFRNSQYFPKYIRDSGALKYWQAKGFPPRCRAVGTDDFQCE